MYFTKINVTLWDSTDIWLLQKTWVTWQMSNVGPSQKSDVGPSQKQNAIPEKKSNV